MSMETEDPFAAVEPDPLTGTTPDEPPVPASDDLPPGVEPGMLGGTDAPAPDPAAEATEQAGEEAKENMLAAGQPDDGLDAPPEPDAPFDEALPVGESGGEDPSESPSESPDPPAEESGAEDGTPLPPEPETAVADTPPPAAGAAKDAKQGGAPSRAYLIFEEIEIDLGGEVTKAYVKRRFGNEATIVARNGPSALKAAGRAIGDGYEGVLAPVPVSMWNPKPVSTKQKDNLSVSVG